MSALCLYIVECVDDTSFRFKFGEVTGPYFDLSDKEFVCEDDKVVTVAEDFDVQCPKTSVICAPMPCVNKCFGAGECEASFCKCDDGFSGDDCSVGGAYVPPPDPDTDADSVNIPTDESPFNEEPEDSSSDDSDNDSDAESFFTEGECDVVCIILIILIVCAF
jgi:hypothetical protein